MFFLCSIWICKRKPVCNTFLINSSSEVMVMIMMAVFLTSDFGVAYLRESLGVSNQEENQTSVLNFIDISEM